MANLTFQFKGGTEANWNEVNPVLAEREVGLVFTSDSDKTIKYIKFGDGTKKFTELPVFHSDIELINELSGKVDTNSTDITTLFDKMAGISLDRLTNIDENISSIIQNLGELSSSIGIASTDNQLKIYSISESHGVTVDNTSITIGNSETNNITNTNNIIIGNSFSSKLTENQTNNISIGNVNTINGKNSIAIGDSAKVGSVNNAVQLGKGTNNIANSLQVHNVNLVTNTDDKNNFKFNTTGILNSINALDESGAFNNNNEYNIVVRRARTAETANTAKLAEDVSKQVYDNVSSTVSTYIDNIDLRTSDDKAAVAIGKINVINNDQAKNVVIGYDTRIDPTTTNSVALGFGASVVPPYEYITNVTPPYIDIKDNKAFNAIQLGKGTNSKQNSLQFFNQRIMSATDINDVNTYKLDEGLVKRSVNGVEISATITKAVSADFANYATNAQAINDIPYEKIIANARKNIRIDDNKQLAITNNIAVGQPTIENNAINNIVIGNNTKVGKDVQTAIAIGNDAVLSANNAIQFGRGTNATANSLQIFDNTIIENINNNNIKIPTNIIQNSIDNIDIKPNSISTTSIQNIEEISGATNAIANIDNITTKSLSANIININDNIIIDDAGHVTIQNENGLILGSTEAIENPVDNTAMRLTDVRKYVNENAVTHATSANILNQQYELTIGEGAIAETSSIAFGTETSAINEGIAIGKGAIANGNVQLGEGENTNASKTLQLFDKVIISKYDNDKFFVAPELIANSFSYTKLNNIEVFDNITLPVEVDTAISAEYLSEKSVDDIQQELIDNNFPIHKTDNGISSNVENIDITITNDAITIANDANKITIDNNIAITTNEPSNIVIGTDVELVNSTNNVILGKFSGEIPENTLNNTVILGTTQEGVTVDSNSLYFNGEKLAFISDDDELVFNTSAVNKVANTYPVSASYENKYAYVGKNNNLVDENIIAIGNNISANSTNGIIISNNANIDNNSYAYGYIGMIKNNTITDNQYDTYSEYEFITATSAKTITNTGIISAYSDKTNEIYYQYEYITYSDKQLNNGEDVTVSAINILSISPLYNTSVASNIANINIIDSINVNENGSNTSNVYDVIAIGYNNTDGLSGIINTTDNSIGFTSLSSLQIPSTIRYISSQAFNSITTNTPFNLTFDCSYLTYAKIIKDYDDASAFNIGSENYEMTFADGSTIKNDTTTLSYNIRYDHIDANEQSSIILLTSAYINIIETENDELSCGIVDTIEQASSYINSQISSAGSAGILVEKTYYTNATNSNIVNDLQNTSLKFINNLTDIDINNIDNYLYIDCKAYSTNNNTNLVIGNSAVVHGNNNIVIGNNASEIFDNNNVYINNTKILDKTETSYVLDKDLFITSINSINDSFADSDALTEVNFLRVKAATEANTANTANIANTATSASIATNSISSTIAVSANNVLFNNAYQTVDAIIGNIPIKLEEDTNSIVVANKHNAIGKTLSNTLLSILPTNYSNISSTTSIATIANTNTNNITVDSSILNANNSNITNTTNSIVLTNKSQINNNVTDSIIITNNTSTDILSGSIILETSAVNTDGIINISNNNKSIVIDNENINLTNVSSNINVDNEKFVVNNEEIINYTEDNITINEQLLDDFLVVSAANTDTPNIINIGKGDNNVPSGNGLSGISNYIGIGNNINTQMYGDGVNRYYDINYITIGNNSLLPKLSTVGEANPLDKNIIIFGSKTSNTINMPESVQLSSTKDIVLIDDNVIIYSISSESENTENGLSSNINYIFNGEIQNATSARIANEAVSANSLTDSAIAYLTTNHFDIRKQDSMVLVGTSGIPEEQNKNVALLNNDYYLAADISANTKNLVVLGQALDTTTDSNTDVSDALVVMGKTIVKYTKDTDGTTTIAKAKLSDDLLHNSKLYVTCDESITIGQNNISIANDSDSIVISNSDTTSTSNNSIIIGNTNIDINTNSILLGDVSGVAVLNEQSSIENSINIGKNNKITNNSIAIGNSIEIDSENTVKILNDDISANFYVGNTKLLDAGKFNSELISFTKKIDGDGKQPDVYYSVFDKIMEIITKINIADTNNTSGSCVIELPNSYNYSDTIFSTHSITLDNINANVIPTYFISKPSIETQNKHLSFEYKCTFDRPTITSDMVSSIPDLLAAGNLPYVSMTDYNGILSEYGVCRCFGWDGKNTTDTKSTDYITYRVPTLDNIFIEAGQNYETQLSGGQYIEAGLPNVNISSELEYTKTNTTSVSNYVSINGEASEDSETTFTYIQSVTTTHEPDTLTFDTSAYNSIYNNSTTVQPPAVCYVPMVQLHNDVIDGKYIQSGHMLGEIFFTSRLDAVKSNELSSTMINGAVVCNGQIHTDTQPQPVMTTPKCEIDLVFKIKLNNNN